MTRVFKVDLSVPCLIGEVAYRYEDIVDGKVIAQGFFKTRWEKIKRWFEKGCVKDATLFQSQCGNFKLKFPKI